MQCGTIASLEQARRVPILLCPFAALGLVGREPLSADPMQHNRQPGAGEARTDPSLSITYRTSKAPCRCCPSSDVSNCQRHPALEQGAWAEGQRRGPVSRL